MSNTSRKRNASQNQTIRNFVLHKRFPSNFNCISKEFDFAHITQLNVEIAFEIISEERNIFMCTL